MAPTADVAQPTSVPTVAPGKLASVQQGSEPKGKLPREPLKLSGVLDRYDSFEVTPVIGREYPTLQIRDLLHAPNSEELLRELAIIISRRGVVFFRNQDLTPDEQKRFTDLVGRAGGKPAEHGLHIHPVANAERHGALTSVDPSGTPNTDNEISVISSRLRREVYTGYTGSAKREWHSDITFEPAPSDYTSLKVHTLPATGGDTLWSSGYEVYDLLSPPLRALADGLTGRFAQPGFGAAAERSGFALYAQPRGSPLNVGTALEADHPFVRTNPVTGWRSVFGVGSHFSHLHGVAEAESALLKQYVLDLVASHHLAQVRFRWNVNDLAVWDNRSVFHAATPDYDGLGERAGVRAVSIGERPYFDPNSRSRRDELGQDRLI